MGQWRYCQRCLSLALDNLELAKLALTNVNGWRDCDKMEAFPVMQVSPPLYKCFPWEGSGQRNQGNIPAQGKLLAETMNHHIVVYCSSSTINSTIFCTIFHLFSYRDSLVGQTSQYKLAV